MTPYAATAAEYCSLATPPRRPPAAHGEDQDPQDVTAIWTAPAGQVVRPCVPRLVENDAIPAFHWAQPEAFGSSEALLLVDDDAPMVAFDGLATEPREEKEHLLTAGVPAWLLPGATLFCVTATVVVSVAPDAIAFARVAFAAGLGLLVGA
ncbi:MAG: hypothetical protein JKY37_33570 [Nannocystaceae bacterium]|nr:hypothetical protein [Nannocystaceae bacterium]